MLRIWCYLLGLLLISSQMWRISQAKVRLCGKKLMETLKTICGDCFFSGDPEDSGMMIQYRKKSSTSSEDSYFEEEFRRSRRGGVADECCIRTCDFSYLKSYCCGEKTPA